MYICTVVSESDDAIMFATSRVITQILCPINQDLRGNLPAADPSALKTSRRTVHYNFINNNIFATGDENAQTKIVLIIGDKVFHDSNPENILQKQRSLEAVSGSVAQSVHKSQYLRRYNIQDSKWKIDNVLFMYEKGIVEVTKFDFTSQNLRVPVLQICYSCPKHEKRKNTAQKETFEQNYFLPQNYVDIELNGLKAKYYPSTGLYTPNAAQ